MKRVLSLALLLSLLALSALAEAPADPLLGQAIALAGRLGELAASEGYAAAYSASSAIDEVIAGWAEGDYGTPAAAQRATLNADAADGLIAELAGAASSGLSETAHDELSRRLLSALPSMVNGAASVEVVAAASVMTIQTAFVCESCDAPALYVLSYERGTPVAVTFEPCQDGAVLAQASFLGLPSDGALEMLGALGVAEWEEIALP